MLAGRACENRPVEPREPAELRENFGVLLFAFAETDSGIDHDSLQFHAGAAGAVNTRIELGADSADNVLHRRQLGPGLRRAAHMIDDQAGIRIGGDPGEIHVKR